MNIAKVKPKDLAVLAVFAEPQDFDYYDRIDWEIIHSVESDDPEYEETVEYEQPMINYFYPLPEFERVMRWKGWDETEVAKELMRTVPLCLVYQDGKYGLALTGGGMDLSWEICEAYIRCGYLPPLHFCKLPRLAGLRLTPTRRKIIACCRESIRWAEKYLQGAKRELRIITEEMKERR